MPENTGDARPLLLGGARLTDGRLVDVRIAGRHIEAVGTAGSLTTRGTRLDLRGHLLLPTPAEPHAHADTALTGPQGGPPSHGAEDVRRRATEAALLQLGHGATALRAHVRVGGAQGLAALEGVLAASRSLRGLTELTAVAVPRLLTGVAGADGLAALRDAVDMGAGVIGGRPDLDPDPASTPIRPATPRPCSHSRRTGAAPSTCTRTVRPRPGWPGWPPWPKGSVPASASAPVRASHGFPATRRPVQPTGSPRRP